MSKPFSIQSPEDIAKEYAGNKQQIAQAMQLGVVDPTAGVLAGMFIDRMRSAQMQEQAPQQTVAQQVMGGAPPPPPPPSGGLGATPQAALQAAPQGAPPMAPPMGMPPEMGMAPPGMAEGGIVGLDIPQNMFDEPTNGGFDDGYAGGGLVAFADGGGIDADALRRALRAQESSGDYGVLNREGSGAMGAYQFMPATARALAKRLGVEYRPDLMQGAKGRSKEGIAYQERLMDEQMKDILRFSKGDPKLAAAYHFAGPNRAGWQDKTAKYQSDIMRRLGAADEALAAVVGLQPPSETLASAVPAAFKAGEEYYAANMPERKNEGLGLLTAEARRVLDPEAQKKRADQDKWMMLAEIGFNMASSNSPYLLQAASAAAAAALPGARAAKKEREAEKREAIRDLAAAEDITYKQAAEKTKFVTDFAAMQLGLKKDDLARSANIWQTQVQEKGATERTAMQVAGQKEVANITAGSYAKTAEAQEEVAKRQAMGRANQAALADANRRFDLAMRPSDPTQARKYDEARDAFFQQRYNFYLKSEIDGDAGGGAGATGGGTIDFNSLKQ